MEHCTVFLGIEVDKIYSAKDLVGKTADCVKIKNFLYMFQNTRPRFGASIEDVESLIYKIFLYPSPTP